MTNAITTDRLTKHYHGRRVVDSLSLNVPTGSVYGLLGRNGAGKSTAIKMLMGMVQPDSGSATLLGEDFARLACATRQRIAYLAEGHPLYGWMTIGQAVEFTRAFYPRWNDVLLGQILDHFELSRRQRYRRLSRGQQAQVSLALAVAPDPELLVLDDPTLGMDTVARRDFLESLIQIIQREGRTILFSSHILGDVERVADRIGIMVGGVLRVDCSTETLRESVRKLVLEFVGTAPESVQVPGQVSCRAVGTNLELVLVGYDDQQREAVEALQPHSIEQIDLNLEDVFIEYTRGKQRSLPLFATETEDAQSARMEGAA